MKNLTLESIKEFFNERAVTLLENSIFEVDSETPIDKGIEDSAPVSKYAGLGNVSKSLSRKFSPELLKKLDSEIDAILKTGRSNRNQEKAYRGDSKDEFNYIANVVAGLYNTLSGSEKENVRTFIFSSFSPYLGSSEQPSTFARLIAKKAKIAYDLAGSKTIDASTYTEMIADAIYKAMDYILSKYDPNKGYFGQLLALKASQIVMDELYQGQKGEKNRAQLSRGGKRSLDEPMGDDENAGTLGDKIAGEEEGGYSHELSMALGDYINEKLKDPKFAKYKELYNLYMKEELNSSEAAEKMGLSVDEVLTLKKNLEKFISAFIKTNEFENYMFNKTGEVLEFPEHDFTFSDKGFYKERKIDEKIIEKAIKEFVFENLDKAKMNDVSRARYKEIFGYYVDDRFDSKTIGEKMALDPRNVRLIKMRLEEVLNKTIEAHVLEKYVKEKTGVEITFPTGKIDISKWGFTLAGGEEGTTGAGKEKLYVYDPEHEESMANAGTEWEGHRRIQENKTFTKASVLNIIKEVIENVEKKDEVYIEFLNKDKGFKKDKKYFKSYEEAVKSAKENFEGFDPDIIKYI